MEYVQLASLLRVGLPPSMDLTYQALEGHLGGDRVICCWKDDELQYIVDADDQPGGLEADEYWSALHECIGRNPDFSKVKLMKSGQYQTVDHHPVSYRIYQMHSDEGTDHHLYHLISNANIAYWVICPLRTLADIFEVNAGVTEIMRTASLISDPALVER